MWRTRRYVLPKAPVLFPHSVTASAACRFCASRTTTPATLRALLDQLAEYRADTAPLPIQEQPFVLSTAPSGTARCRSCGFTIAEGDLRIGVLLRSSSGDFAVPSWHHLHCFETIHMPFYASCYYPSPPPAAATGQGGAGEPPFPSPLLLPLPSPPIYSTSKHLTRDLALGALELMASLRAITGNYGFTLTEAQYKEVSHVAQRCRLARASVKKPPTSAAAVRARADHEKEARGSKGRNARRRARGQTARPQRQEGGEDDERTSPAALFSPEKYYMDLPALVAELELNYGNAAVRRYLLERVPALGPTSPSSQWAKLQPHRALLEALVADGRAFGALAKVCDRCKGLLRASSRGGAECTSVLDAFTACAKTFTAQEVQRKPWKLYKGREGNNDGKRTVYLPLEDVVGSLGGVRSFTLEVYNGDFGQFDIPLLSAPQTVLGSGGSHLAGVVVAPRPVQPANLFHNMSLCASSAGARALSQMLRQASTPTLLQEPKQIAAIMDAAVGEMMARRRGGKHGADPPSELDFFARPFWGPRGEYVRPSTDPAGYYLPSHRWLGIARTAKEATTLLSHIRAALTCLPARALDTRPVPAGKDRPKKTKTAMATASASVAAVVEELLGRIPFFSPAYLALCQALGHRPPYLDESPYGDLYLANKPVLTAAQRAKLEKNKTRKQRLLASSPSPSSSLSSSLQQPGAAVAVAEVAFNGKYPVDYLCPEAATFSVEMYASAPLVAHSVILTKTDLVKGKNSFYILQVLRKHPNASAVAGGVGAGPGGPLSKLYYVYRRWGRVGEERQSGTSLSKPMERYEAVQLFHRIFEEKTGNNYGVILGTRAFRKRPGMFHFTPTSSVAGLAVATTPAPPPPPATAARGAAPPRSVQALHPETRALLHDLFNPAGLERQMYRMRIDLTKLPLGNLNAAALDEATKVIGTLSRAVKKIDAAVAREAVRWRRKAAAELKGKRSTGNGGGTRSKSGDGGLDSRQAQKADLFLHLTTGIDRGHGKDSMRANTLGTAQSSTHGPLTDAQLKAEVRKRLRLPRALQQQVVSLSNHFYSLIPHVMSARPQADRSVSDGFISLNMDTELLLDTAEKLAEKQQTIDDLRDVLRTRQLVEMSASLAAEDVARDVYWSHYENIGANLRYLGPHRPQHRWRGWNEQEVLRADTGSPSSSSRHTRKPNDNGGKKRAGEAAANPFAYHDNLLEDPALTYERVVQYFTETQSTRHRKAVVTGVWQVARRGSGEATAFAEYVESHQDFIATPVVQVPTAQWAEKSGTGSKAGEAAVEAGEGVRRQPVKRMLLWHGSRLVNWVRICNEGLCVAPSNVMTTGSMFGHGIYFADCSSKSCGYAHSYGNTLGGAHGGAKPKKDHDIFLQERKSETYEHVLALCEVAVGATPLVLYRSNSSPKLLQYFENNDSRSHQWQSSKGEAGQKADSPPFVLTKEAREQLKAAEASLQKLVLSEKRKKKKRPTATTTASAPSPASSSLVSSPAALAALSFPRRENQYSIFAAGDIGMAGEERLPTSGVHLPRGKAMLLWDKVKRLGDKGRGGDGGGGGGGGDSVWGDKDDSIQPLKLREDVQMWVEEEEARYQHALAAYKARHLKQAKKQRQKTKADGTQTLSPPERAPLSRVIGARTTLLHNEYVVYDAAQVRIRYLVAFKWEK